MAAWLERGQHLGPREQPGQRQARCDRLGHDEDVRLDVPVPHREQLTGPAEPGLDLVGDEEDPVLAGDLAEARQEPRRRDDVAALTDDRLDDDRRDLVRIHELVEQQVEPLLPVARACPWIVRSAGRPVAVRVVGVVDAAGERLEGAAVDILRRGEGHRLAGAPVELVAERDDRRPARRRTRQLDRALDGLGPGVGGMPATVRPAGDPAAARTAAGLVIDDVLLAVEQLGGLRLDRRHDPRMRVPVLVTPIPDV